MTWWLSNKINNCKKFWTDFKIIDFFCYNVPSFCFYISNLFTLISVTYCFGFELLSKQKPFFLERNGLGHVGHVSCEFDWRSVFMLKLNKHGM